MSIYPFLQPLSLPPLAQQAGHRVVSRTNYEQADAANFYRPQGFSESMHVAWKQSFSAYPLIPNPSLDLTRISQSRVSRLRRTAEAFFGSKNKVPPAVSFVIAHNKVFRLSPSRLRSGLQAMAQQGDPIAGYDIAGRLLDKQSGSLPASVRGLLFMYEEFPGKVGIVPRSDWGSPKLMPKRLKGLSRAPFYNVWVSK